MGVNFLDYKYLTDFVRLAIEIADVTGHKMTIGDFYGVLTKTNQF